MKYLLVLTILLSGAFMLAQVKPPKYQPSELQTLRLKVAQQQAQLAQKDLFIAQQNFQAALSALKTEGETVKQENKWDTGVVFNPETLGFFDPPKLSVVPSPDEVAK